MYPRHSLRSHGARRDTAPVPPIKILYRDSLPAPIKLVPPLLLRISGAGATRVMLNKICTRTAKSAPPLSLRYCGAGSPSLHRDSFLAKVPGPCPVLSSGNSHRRILAPRYSDIKCRNLTLGPPYCRAVGCKVLNPDKTLEDIFIIFVKRLHDDNL